MANNRVTNLIDHISNRGTPPICGTIMLLFTPTCHQFLMVSDLVFFYFRSVFVIPYPPPSVDLSWSFLRLEAMLLAWVVIQKLFICDLLLFQQKKYFSNQVLVFRHNCYHYVIHDNCRFFFLRSHF